jgi:hypothetical protein
MYPASTSGCAAETVAVAGGAPLWCGNASGVVQISPDGTLVAASSGEGPGATTTIYTNGALTTAVNGWVVGWLDNTRVLAEQFGPGVSKGPSPVYEGANIFSSSGTDLGSPPIPWLQSLQPVTSDSIYSSSTNTIMSLTTGATLWASANTSCLFAYNCLSVGAVTGSQVIFTTGALVLAQPY